MTSKRQLAIVMHSPERRFFLLWLCSAALVTVLRFLQPVAPGHDLGLQIQAAQNLVAGNGLSLYEHTGPGLTDSASLNTLTKFTAGYSLLAAALFALGLGVGLVIKVLGAIGTMVGWWGWGKLADPFFSQGLKRSLGWKWAAFAIATSTPLLFTPDWGGTDILLWAAVPWVVVCLVRASEKNVTNARGFDGLAGVCCGLALLMRYASVFLAAYAACVILWQSRLRIPVLTRRLGVFGLGFLPALALQVYINYFLSNSAATPGALLFNVAPGAVVGRLWNGFSLLYTANYTWAFWVPGIVNIVLFPEAVGALPWQLVIALGGFTLLVLAAKTYGNHLTAASRDPRVAVFGLFVAIPVTLLACMMFGTYDYVGDRRYYLPIVPLSVFVAYSLASLIDVPKRRSVTRLLQTSCALYLTGYIAMSLVYVMFLPAPGRIGASQRQKLMGNKSHQWPSMAVTYELSPARNFVMPLLKEEPGALLLTSQAGGFHWDSAVDQSRLYDLNCIGLRATYLSGPARIVIHSFDDGRPQDLWYYVGNGITGGKMRADCFERLPNLKILQRFPEEGVKVLETRVGAGEHVILKP